ncbi:hypothetical protein IWX50DRAFT_658271 [Phyllosticta citricarpa]
MLDWTSGQVVIPNPFTPLTNTYPLPVHNIIVFILWRSVIDKVSSNGPVSSATDGQDKAVFLNTGGESNEAAIKRAENYTGKFEIVGLQRARSTTLDELGHGPMMSGNLIFPAPSAYRSIFRHADGTYDWQTELSDGFSLVDRASCGSLAALIVEPILSSGGMTELPDGWLEEGLRIMEEALRETPRTMPLHGKMNGKNGSD